MTYVAAVLSDAPAAWYRLAEASGNLGDSSGNANHTNATEGAGSATYGEAGPVTNGKALLFNAPFAFRAPDHPTLDVGDVFTLEAWIKLRNFAVAEQWVLSKGIGGYAMRMTLTGADMVFELVVPGVAVIVSSAGVGGGVAGIWRHLVITKSGATVKQYWNGTDVTGAVTNAAVANNASPLLLGVRASGEPPDFNHWLAEPAVYPTALTQARVQAHYDAAAAPSTPSTISSRLWPCRLGRRRIG